MSSIPDSYVDEFKQIVLAVLGRVEQLSVRVINGIERVRGAFGQEIVFDPEGNTTVKSLRFERLASAPATPYTGLTYYDSALDKLYVYIGTTWIDIGGGGAASDHGSLTGLTDYDHDQYLRLDGNLPMTGNLSLGIYDVILDSGVVRLNNAMGLSGSIGFTTGVQNYLQRQEIGSTGNFTLLSDQDYMHTWALLGTEHMSLSTSDGLKMFAKINMNGMRIEGVPTPNANGEAANKLYVDNAAIPAHNVLSNLNWDVAGHTINADVWMYNNRVQLGDVAYIQDVIAELRYLSGNTHNFYTGGSERMCVDDEWIEMYGGLDIQGSGLIFKGSASYEIDAITSSGTLRYKAATRHLFVHGSANTEILSIESAGINLNNLKIANLATPTLDDDAATKFYVDNNSGISDHGSLTGLADYDHDQYLRLNGGLPMTGNLSMGGNSLDHVSNLYSPEAVSMAFLHRATGGAATAIAGYDANQFYIYKPLWMAADIDMKNHKLLNVGGGETQSFTNLLENGDFEVWSAGDSAAPDRWRTGGGVPTIVRETSVVKIGSTSVLLTSTSTNSALIASASDYVRYQGRTVTVGVWIKSSNTGARVFIVDGSGYYHTEHSGGGDWEWITKTLVVNSAATKLEVHLTADNLSGTGSAYFDGAILVEGSVCPAFSPKPVSLISEALETYKQSFQNILKNGNFESWSNGSTSAPDGWTTGGAGAVISRQTTHYFGVYGAKLENGAGAEGYVQSTPNASDYSGRVITFHCWVYTTVGGRAHLVIYDSQGSSYENSSSAYHTGGGWELLTVTRALRDSLTYLICRIRIDTGTVIAIYADGAICVEGMGCPTFSPRPLFDDGASLQINPNTNAVTLHRAPTADMEVATKKYVDDNSAWNGAATSNLDMNGYDIIDADKIKAPASTDITFEVNTGQTFIFSKV